MAYSTDKRRDPVVVGSLWMLIVSLVLFFLPGINGVIGGIVGGYKVGGVKRALGAAVLPACAAFAGIWALLALFHLRAFAFLAGAAGGMLALFSSIGLLIGALIGGALGSASQPARLRA